jgi:hypothetical protein
MTFLEDLFKAEDKSEGCVEIQNDTWRVMFQAGLQASRHQGINVSAPLSPPLETRGLLFCPPN